jgi:hypothetical protein
MRIFTLFIVLFCFPITILAQDTLWKMTIVNNELSLQLPAKSSFQKASFVQAYGGEVYSNYFALQYYDTTFLAIDTEEDFRISLIGFVSGRARDSTLKEYEALVTDTTLGGAKGLFATFSTANTSAAYKHIYYFVTLANNKYYWFQVYSQSVDRLTPDIDFFFDSIKFNISILKEKSFSLSPVHLTKKAE